jgi:hypothetical protein
VPIADGHEADRTISERCAASICDSSVVRLGNSALVGRGLVLKRALRD